ncbi:cytochrome c oxidase subunit II [Cobetia sp. MC34]|uniref:cytochrome c oxidase subunit II n=1 Tax=Cobetia sp. MC34 TaxID=2785080 RepID=UPI001BCA0A2E|nr:cytochrome c oxidase subunit II [Cobetia sp. MC34]MBS4155048.1 cytochrome c oxidase subunit II [Cobetia sp. MC34]
MRLRLRRTVTTLSLTVLSPSVLAVEYNMPVGVTAVSREIHSLHMIIFWICVVIGIVVFGVMGYAMIKHRKSRGAVSASFHENTRIEILWTAIPLLILVVMAVPATATLKDMYDASESALDVKITGHQWRWQYEYLGEDVAFTSSLATPREQINNTAAKGEHYLLEVGNPLVLPINRKVRFLTTSADVIHSWWVPDFGVKKDAIPGFINEAWTRIETPGTYRGQCTELCGKDHGFMPVVVEALPEAEFDEWLIARKAEAEAALNDAGRDWSLEELMEKGEKTYATICASCHQPDGQGMPPAFPSLVGSAIVTQDMQAHIDIVVNGKAGTPMAAFADVLSPVELAAVITYERNAWGNDTGELVQPAVIKEQLSQ